MIAGVVLAAGASSRLGRPKQLLPLDGRPLTQHVIDAAIAADLDPVVVVLGHAADDVRAGLELSPQARVIINAAFETGQASSLRAGIEALGPGVRAAVILLGDQPGIRAEVIRGVMHTHASRGGPAVRASYGGTAGHPVLFDRSVWPELKLLRGDRGARDLLEAHPEWVVPFEVEGEPPRDIDEWDDYERVADRSIDRQEGSEGL